jgi:hypothetical protein
LNTIVQAESALIGSGKSKDETDEGFGVFVYVERRRVLGTAAVEMEKSSCLLSDKQRAEEIPVRLLSKNMPRAR